MLLGRRLKFRDQNGIGEMGSDRQGTCFDQRTFLGCVKLARNRHRDAGKGGKVYLFLQGAEVTTGLIVTTGKTGSCDRWREGIASVRLALESIGIAPCAVTFQNKTFEAAADGTWSDAS